MRTPAPAPGPGAGPHSGSRARPPASRGLCLVCALFPGPEDQASLKSGHKAVGFSVAESRVMYQPGA